MKNVFGRIPIYFFNINVSTVNATYILQIIVKKETGKSHTFGYKSVAAVLIRQIYSSKFRLIPNYNSKDSCSFTFHLIHSSKIGKIHLEGQTRSRQI